jgi:hypothetical protein
MSTDMGSSLELNTEYPPPDEQVHIDSLIRELRGKMEKDYARTRTLRDAHPKIHGCVRGQLSILPDLSAELAIGLFRTSRTFPVWVRFSNQSNTVSPDAKGDIRGVAIKLMGVDGDKLLPSETQSPTHDFIMISDSRFVTKDVAEFDGLIKGLVGNFITLGWFFLTHWRVGRNLFTSLRKFSNPLTIRYFSVVPYLLGRRAVKYSLIPRDAVQTPVPSSPSDDYLKEAMVSQLKSGNAVFDFCVQFQTDAVKMPIEDPGITWDERLSPFTRVATLTIPSQVFDTASRQEFGDNLSFNPWRCLAEHRPLGGINRARKQVYQSLSIFRHDRNQAPRVEPTVNDREFTSAQVRE